MAEALPYRIEKDHLFLHIRLTPKGGRDGFDGITTGADGKCALQARVRAVPENGAANEALIALLAKTLRLRKSDIDLVAGATARQKTLRLAGKPDELAACLAPLLVS